MILRRTILTMATVAMLTLSACSGGGGAYGGGGGGGVATATPTPTGGGGGGDASATPIASTPIVESGAPSPSPADGGGSGSSGAKQVPDDACSVITDTDIKGLFGAGRRAGRERRRRGQLVLVLGHEGQRSGQGLRRRHPQIVGSTFDDGYISYDEEHAAMGDAVDKVEGLGSEAWIGLGAIHVDLGDDNELVVTTVIRRDLRPDRHHRRALRPGQDGAGPALAGGPASSPRR